MPGREEKGFAAKKIALSLGISTDEALLALPSGGFTLKERK